MKKKIIVLIAVLVFPILAFSQLISGFRSVSEGAYPEIRWAQKGVTDSATFAVYRARVGSAEFTEIKTPQFITWKSDSVFYRIIDTTLTVKGLYQYFIEAWIKGKRVRSEILFGHNMGNVPSPVVVGFTAGSVTGRKALELNWKLSSNTTVRSMALFRSRDHENGYELIATLPAEAVTYTDNVERANEPWFYFLMIHDFFGYQLPSVRIHGISTFSEKPYPPQDFTAVHQGSAVQMNWRGVGNNINGYRVYRRVNEAGRFAPVGEMIYSPGETVSYSDTSISLPGMLNVAYYSVSVSDGYLESNPTDTVFISLAGNQPVSPPAELDYTIDSTGRVMLLWTSMADNALVKGYHVYRKGNDQKATQLNKELIPYSRNYFTDDGLNAYGTFTYEVASVSSLGQPSLLRTSVRADRPAPVLHLVVSAVQTDAGVVLSWKPLLRKELKKLSIYRKTGDEAAVLVASVNDAAGLLTDNKFKPGNIQIYYVVAQMNDGTTVSVNDGIMVRTEVLTK